MNVVSWLTGLGLGEYAAAFLENEIDTSILPTLTQDDLRDLGVVKIGHRRRLMNAIGELGGQGPAERQPRPEPDRVPEAAPADAAPARSDAERRHLTVLFCDMVGSTALSARLDPEEMSDVVRAYQDACAGVIARFEGFVAKFMGDGILAYFGYPQAHEDDAERAVRAGLALTEATGRVRAPDGTPLAARVGVATGLVVVGDLIGDGASQELTVVGDAPNLAARLQTLARPGQLVIDGPTRRLLADRFHCESLGAPDLKGLSEAAEAFLVGGERTVESRFDARTGEILPMVGRDQELDLLMERWSRVRSGEGQCVLLVGEAGIGKSRILRSVHDAIGGDDHIRIHYQCSPYYSDTALWPAVNQLAHAAEFEPGDSPDARLDKLEAVLRPVEEAPDTRPLLADLMGLNGARRYGPLELTPQARRARTLEALVLQLLSFAAEKPVLMILEDAHWVDPTTLELIELCLDAVTRGPILLLITSRPDNQPEIAAHPHVTRLTLNRLGRAGVEKIVERLGGEALPRETIDAIVARTDGVPLYVEELTKAVLETGETTIPASLHDSLMARLDRIPDVKEVAQIAACIGREFDYPLLARVVDMPESKLRESLDRLATAELIFRRGTPSAQQYLFKHALVRDAAYESLLRRRREAVHRRLVDVLEATEGTAPEVLARHTEAAGMPGRAVDHWQRAGREALTRPAYKEAIASFGAAIRLCRTLGDDPAWTRRELEIEIELGQALIANLGYQAPPTLAAFERAVALAETIGDRGLLIPAIYGLWASRYINSVPSADLAVRMASLTDAGADDGRRCVATRMLALERFHAGEYRESLRLVDAALAIYDDVRHRDLGRQFGHDPRVAATHYKAWNQWFLGKPGAARVLAEGALDWARQLDHPNTLGLSLCFGVALTNIWLRDVDRAEQAARESIEHAEEKSLALWQAWGQIHLGWALGERNDPGAIASFESGLDAGRQIGARRFEAFHLGLLADLQSTLGRHDDAARTLRAAFDNIAKWPDTPFEADLHRVNGLVRLRASAGAAAEARADFTTALDIARRQGAVALELRALRELAALDTDRGGPPDSREALREVLARVEGGDTTRDVIEARAVLA